MIATYISGHGYGHATRVAEVLRALRARAPEVELAVVTSAPESLFRGAVPGAFTFRALECDVGVAQHGALVLDERATAMRWAQFHAGWGDLVTAEASWLRQRGAQLVFADIPPLAFAAAAAAGVGAVGMANFSWDWIYGHLARREPALAAAADACAEAYRTAGLLLQLPFAGDLGVFPKRESIPLVARRPRVPREETRRRLGWPSGTVVLLSFGGMGLPGFDPRVLAPLTDGWFVAVGGAWTDAPANVGAVAPERLAELELRYEDVVGAADVVVTKPGYGIVSDAIGASVRLVYTDRGDFPEYPILVREMERYLPSAYVDNEALLGGTLRNALDRVLAIPMPDPPRLDGASVAAERLLQLTGARSL